MQGCRVGGRHISFGTFKPAKRWKKMSGSVGRIFSFWLGKKKSTFVEVIAALPFPFREKTMHFSAGQLRDSGGTAAGKHKQRESPLLQFPRRWSDRPTGRQNATFLFSSFFFFLSLSFSPTSPTTPAHTRERERQGRKGETRTDHNVRRGGERASESVRPPFPSQYT